MRLLTSAASYQRILWACCSCQNIEQFLMGLRVEALGAGIVVRNNRQEHDFAGLLEDALNKSRYRQSAQAFAQQYAGYAPGRTIDKVIQLIDSTLKTPACSAMNAS